MRAQQSKTAAGARGARQRAYRGQARGDRRAGCCGPRATSSHRVCRGGVRGDTTEIWPAVRTRGRAGIRQEGGSGRPRHGGPHGGIDRYLVERTSV